jgi:hypothetical protein
MNRFFTQGTGHLTRLIEGDAASAVESMAARKELNGISGFMEGFQTDRTVYAARVIQTDMGIYTIHINTDITLIAVNMIVRTTHSTDTALVAVILTLVLIIQENTCGAPIGAHGCVTRFTDLLGALNGLARQAFDLFHGLSVHGMGQFRVLLILILDLVVTEPTGKELLAARG